MLLTLTIQDPKNAILFLSTEKAMVMFDAGMDRHEKLQSLHVLG